MTRFPPQWSVSPYPATRADSPPRTGAAAGAGGTEGTGLPLSSVLCPLRGSSPEPEVGRHDQEQADTDHGVDAEERVIDSGEVIGADDPMLIGQQRAYGG